MSENNELSEHFKKRHTETRNVKDYHRPDPLEGINSEPTYERAPPLQVQEEMGSIKVDFKRLHPRAVLPERKTHGAAAADVYAVKDTELKPGVTTLVDLGFAVTIPEGYELILTPRSGFSCKGITVRNSPGTIDSDYRGEMKVILQYQPENLCQAVTKLYKVMHEFARNLVSVNAFDTARSRLMDHVKNNPFESYTIKAGDRIGQLKLCKVIPHHFSKVDELDTTERGDGGFGSTGR